MKITLDKTIFIGTIPRIFGYGLSVAADSEAEVMKGLRKGFKQWVAQFKEGYEYTFPQAFEHYGGRVDEVILGKCYHDDFGC